MSTQHSLFILIPLSTIPEELQTHPNDVSLLQQALHSCPFKILGAHKLCSSKSLLRYIVIRVWKHDVTNICLTPVDPDVYRLSPLYGLQKRVPLSLQSEALFHCAFQVELCSDNPNYEHIKVSNDIDRLFMQTPFHYNIHIKRESDSSSAWCTTYDPYSFQLLLSEHHLSQFMAGTYYEAGNLMGAHITTINGIQGVRFSVWAPQAKVVSVVGSWNQWNPCALPMRLRIPFGVWELFVPDISAGERYAYSIVPPNNDRIIKIDPYAQEYENPPKIDSIVSGCDDVFKPEKDRFVWEDQLWLENREKLGTAGRIHFTPMSIYEIHLPSWMRGDNNRHLTYRELAHRIVDHIKMLNMTHVEFLPITHHPYEGSWGYQSTGYYAPYSRLGNPDDVKFLINELHKNNIGVFLDFALGHFAKDSWGLVRYDGTPCYEYSDPREGEHKGWGTTVFNYGRHEVLSFLLGVVNHWIQQYHIDGIRVDAVSSIIYKNFGREEGDWIPNALGGDANIQGINLLQSINRMVHNRFPGVFTIAEESTSWQGVTDKHYGLGFDSKWDLGWMNDTLSYLCTPIYDRSSKHTKLTFRGLYASHESWVLPLSHDEVVHGKGSILDKCEFYGTCFETKLRTLRTLLAFQVTMPGRPLLFMGTEFAQGREWRSNQSLDWHEANEPLRKKLTSWISDLFQLYKTEPAFHEGDEYFHNFKWCDCDNSQASLIAWFRLPHHTQLPTRSDIFIACNFSHQSYTGYLFGVHHCGPWEVVLNSDDQKSTEGRPHFLYPVTVPWNVNYDPQIRLALLLLLRRPRR